MVGIQANALVRQICHFLRQQPQISCLSIHQYLLSPTTTTTMVTTQRNQQQPDDDDDDDDIIDHQNDDNNDEEEKEEEDDVVAALNTLRNYFMPSKDNHGNSTNTVSTVHLSFCKIGNAGLQRLLPAFVNTHVNNLSLQGNDVQGVHGGRVLEQLLTDNDALRSLKLADNHQLGVHGVRGLGRGLAHNCALVTLNLTYCKIGNVGVAVLLPPPPASSSSIDDDDDDSNNDANAVPAIVTNDSLEPLRSLGRESARRRGVLRNSVVGNRARENRARLPAVSGIGNQSSAGNLPVGVGSQLP